MNVMEKTDAFLQEFSMTNAEFCRRVRISPSAFYAWRKGKLDLGKETLGRIEDYLARYDSILEESK